ncbi:ligand-binding protein SH3 [Phyllobacterium brassicacearum]|uniref:Ligand-binding protein SH3 n=1 Tax=Phyllobacterium brassicacearum TaxID=314235 RepID=A0A2P7BR00_9HYPH|nr:SH3 domain-containing protein [Phyllobacterium brassicacearum]PSH68884.1 ligand-binding protein SH3 [Phyllobacterium brassicacearum]
MTSDRNCNPSYRAGTTYGRVATLAPELRVNVLTCQSNWCRIGYQGMRGWLSANYLERSVAVGPTIVVRPTVVVRPPYCGRPPYRPRPPYYRPRPTCRIAPGYPCR